MMKRSFCGARNSVALTIALSMCAALTTGCGTIDASGFLGLATCDILNCDGVLFSNVADDHDDMADMGGMDDGAAHDDEGDDHMDALSDEGADDHMDDMGGMDGGDALGDEGDDHMDGADDDAMDAPMDDMDGHDDNDAEEEEHDDATEGDDGSAPGAGR